MSPRRLITTTMTTTMTTMMTTTMTTTSEAKSFAGDGALKLFSDAPGYDEVVKRFVVEMWNGDDASGCGEDVDSTSRAGENERARC